MMTEEKIRELIALFQSVPKDQTITHIHTDDMTVCRLPQNHCDRPEWWVNDYDGTSMNTLVTLLNFILEESK